MLRGKCPGQAVLGRRSWAGGPGQVVLGRRSWAGGPGLKTQSRHSYLPATISFPKKNFTTDEIDLDFYLTCLGCMSFIL